MLSVERILADSLRRIVTRGELRVRFASGVQRSFGNAREGEAPVAIHIVDPGAELAVVLDPGLRLGEMYMDDRLRMEQGNVYDLLSLLKRNGLRRGATKGTLALQALRTALTYGKQQLSPELSKRNVAHHYDLDERLFRLFLDQDMQYSCAYFEHEGQSLDAAQLAKKRHIAAKLLVEPGQRVLDIGSGWGGMALYLAQVAEARVTGVTLSEEQLRVSRERSQAQGLADRARFELQDYRAVQGSFERIVSVGMFEHVGKQAYGTFFETLARLASKRGIVVLHSIGRTRPLRSPNPFVDKYIFPHSYIPALSEVLPAVESAGFLVKDAEILPLHYAQTLRLWRERFLARRSEVLALYDERFLRMWEFYLAVSETAFRHDRMFVFQLQLCRHQDAVPIRRDYLNERKVQLRGKEAAHPIYRQLSAHSVAAIASAAQRESP